MNQAEMENSLRALLAERAERAPLNDNLAEAIIGQAVSGITPPRQLHRPVIRRRNWTMPLLAVAAVAAVVAGTVGFLTVNDTSSGHGNVPIAHGPTTPTPTVTTPAQSNSSPPVAVQSAFVHVNSTESNGAQLVHLAGFRAVDLTFVGKNIWAMGSATCIKTGVGRCSALVHSTDGVHWTMLNTTPFNVADDTAGCATVCVEHIRFATPSVGYIFGPDTLLMTKNAGRTWTAQPGGAFALETLDNNVIRVTAQAGGCPPGCTFTVQTSAIGSTTWRTEVLPGTAPGVGVQLARTASSAYLLATANPAGGAGTETSVLYTSDNDGKTWINRGEVCGQNSGSQGEVDSVAVTGGSDGSIIVACNPRLASATSRAWVTVSTNGGSSFHRTSADLPAAYPSLVGAGTAQDICVQDDVILYCTQNAGASFSKAHTSNGNTVNATWLGFEDQQDGRALQIGGSAASPSTNLWTTHDGGRTWTLTVGIG